MRLFLLRLLMRLTGSLGPTGLSKIDVDKMNEWLMSLSAENCGYKHYYTMRKKHILEGMVSGISQEEYWMNHGRIAELKYINAVSNKLLKDKKYEGSKKNGESDARV